MQRETAAMLMNVMIFSPLVGLAFIPFVKKELAKKLALASSFIPLILNVLIFMAYLDEVALGMASDAGSSFPLYQSIDWFHSFTYNINFITGMDGISVFLVLLTTILFPLTIYYSFGSVDKYEKSYYSLLLILEVGVIGFFLSLDMVMFYVFFEMVLIPMYFLIGLWGGKQRIYASVKFFLYTLVGSLLMLVAIIYAGYYVGPENSATGLGDVFTSNYADLMAKNFSPDVQGWLFLAFALSFAIKVPLFPLHTWLPDAHTEAPTAGSVILAGVLLKMGTYGMVRFCLPLFPEASLEYSGWMCFLAVVGIIYGGMAAMVQKDVKRLVAYSSVSHLGFIVLGIFSFTTEAMSGAVIQMVNHGISTGALFLMVGMIYDRRHTRMISDFQGLAKVIPVFTLFFMITVLSSVGLPGLNGFVGEFLILLGSFNSHSVWGGWAILASTGVIIAAVYLLWMFRRVMFGTLDKDENRSLKDMNRKEILVMIPLVILMFVFGFYPKPLLKEIDRSSIKIVKEVNPGYSLENSRESQVDVPLAKFEFPAK